jgi:uncharacterized protein
MAPPSSSELADLLHSFCAMVTEDREESHGVVHMNQVKKNAMTIWDIERASCNDLNTDRITSLIVAVALLHDVADHKYGDVERQTGLMKNELDKYFCGDDVTLILDIINKISYSKEAKIRSSGVIPTWDELGLEGKMVRNIVSDADKLEAIGVIGVIRCMQFTTEKLKEKGEPASAAILVNRLVEHGHEKLFILKDEYIMTRAGKALAQERHDIMMAETERLVEFVKNNPMCSDPTFPLEGDDAKLIREALGHH